MITTAQNSVPAARPEDGAEEVEARDADADLCEEAGVGEEGLEAAVVVEQPERGRVQAQLQQELDGRAEGLAPGLGRVGNVRLALKLGKVLQSRPLVRSAFCPKKIDHKSGLTLHPGYNLVWQILIGSMQK